jgi:hypothetical protein
MNDLEVGFDSAIFKIVYDNTPNKLAKHGSWIRQIQEHVFMIKKIFQRMKKRPTDKAYRHLIKLYKKFLNPLVVFSSVGHKRFRIFSNFREPMTYCRAIRPLGSLTATTGRDHEFE